ncbi:hypothetical protein GHT06_013600 [Daphnia sinensis]|uniref:TNFR-Cys domain-containing protein n=1 Tax=Daphnia sinensis TaxID=1820382 RepID=A0AAD5LCV1_9CRUS|nr:hypothetical protein GHT06_013600 [Daphnia sinensis]
MARFIFVLLIWNGFLVHHFPFSHGLEICREDTECSTPDNYCFNGFCEYCIPCQQFLRQPPYSGACAKHEEDCGPCLPGAVAEELVRMRYDFRCKKVDELISGSSTTQPFTIPDWATWTSSIAVLVMVTGTVVTLYMKLKKNSVSRHDQLSDGTSPPTSEKVTAQVAVERDAPHNPDWREEEEEIQPLTSIMMSNEERRLGRLNNVQAQPMNDPFGRNLGDDLNSSNARLLLDVIPSDSEGSANNDVSTGAYNGVTVELSNYRNEITRNQENNSTALLEEASNQTEQPSLLPSYTSPTSDVVSLPIEIEPGGSHNGSEEDTGERRYEKIEFGFLLKIKRIIMRTPGRVNNISGPY